MLTLEPGAMMIAGGLSGDFTLPKYQDEKLAFIAGGIGVTPFRSMLKYLSDKKEQRDIVFLYSNRSASEIAYEEIFDAAEQTIGLRTIYAITDTDEMPNGRNFHRGRIDANLVRQEIPDYLERTFYISGTHAMVSTFEKDLATMGVPRSQIKSDFFPGFA